MRTGDTIYHKPTKERWVVAAVFEEKGEMSWVGWPEGWANIADCEIVKECTDKEHHKLLQELAAMKSSRDHRQRYAVARLACVEEMEKDNG